MIRDIEMIRQVYEKMAARQDAARKVFGRPMTLAEKILSAHLSEPLAAVPERRRSYQYLTPDRVAMQDATAQMALLQFMQAGRDEVAVPSTVHCDHLIRAHVGADPDLDAALEENNEVYAFLKTVAAKYGIGFWKPGSGIIHQVILENYAFPGGMMIGTDSHTPNAGGLGMVAIGIGGADAVDVMAGLPWELQWPGAIGVKLAGKLGGWTSAKDVILKVLDILTVKGGTGCIVEYFGDGVESISCTGKATITNMGAELGATCSLFPFDSRMADYLRATDRGEVADLADAHARCLVADDDVVANPQDYYDRVIEIDLSSLEAHVVGPFTPDLARPLSVFKDEIAAKDYPEELKVGLIGSCTNSSYEDIDRVASIARQAKEHGIEAQSEILITPGSERVRATIERDGQLALLGELGGVVLANACGPCIGQWQRRDTEKGVRNSIITSFNRNFRSRADSNPETLAFIGSPETVLAMAIAGRISFNPATDTLTTADGREVKLEPPTGAELPPEGFVAGLEGFVPPAEDGSGITVNVDPESERIELLEPFAAWDGEDIEGLLVLLKAVGKCTTDHISPAGPWLKYRGHLSNISRNMFTGANNAFTDEPGTGNNVLIGKVGGYLSKIAEYYKEQGRDWIAVGDENYGEGSSREHAAMSPRFLGCRAVLVRSFARIHETNLKKQGVLPLTFADPADYDRIEQTDKVAIRGLADLAPGTPVTIELTHKGGEVETFSARHTLSPMQIQWFQAGSALNYIRQQRQ